MNLSNNSKNILITGCILISIIFPYLANSVWLSVGTTFLIFSTLALSQDMILGRAGIYAMGHAMFFGLGAYAFAIMLSHYNVNLVIAFISAGIITGIIGMVLARPILHLRGDYFLVVSLGLNIIFTQIINNDPFGLTGGPNGIFAININTLLGIDFSNPKIIYFIALLLLLIVILLLNNLNYSKIGRALYYVNHDEIAARSVGINPTNIKLLIFALGTMIAGFAGSIFVLQYSAVSPDTFDINQSILLFAVVIVGGQGSLAGVIAGSFIMFVIPEIFRSFAEVRYLIFGIAMVVLMVIRPSGILPNKFRFYRRKLLKND